MQALFIGQTYIDVTLVADQIPTGDDKDVARDYAVSFGGNAVTAAFCCARLGIPPDLLTIARRRLARAACSSTWRPSIRCRCMAGKSSAPRSPSSCPRATSAPSCAPATTTICIRVRRSISPAAARFISTAICRTPRSNTPRQCREAGILTSLDGGGLRVNTMELLAFIDVAVVSERFCEQLNMSSAARPRSPEARRAAGSAASRKARAVILWYDENGAVQTMPALAVPAREIVDTNGAGDVFHGAYVYSYLARPELSWEAHFRFARAASAHAIRFLGNEARLPTLADVEDRGAPLPAGDAYRLELYSPGTGCGCRAPACARARRVVLRDQHVERRHHEEREQRADGDAAEDHQPHREARHRRPRRWRAAAG